MKDKIKFKRKISIKNIRKSFGFFYELNLTASPLCYKRPFRLYGGKRNPDKKIVILRYSNLTIGIGEVMRELIADMQVLEKRGWTPVIDFEWEDHFLDRQLGIENMWEYCFRQPGNITLEEALQSKNVYVAEVDWYYDKLTVIKKENYRKYYGYYGKICNQYCQLNDTMCERIHDMEHTMFPKGEKVMGVNIREGFIQLDKTDGKIAGEHPRHPHIDEIVQTVREHMKKWNCKWIFLAAQYEDTIQIFKEEFGDNVLYVTRNRWKNYDKNEKMLSKRYITGDAKAGRRLRENRRKAGKYDDEIMQGYLSEIYGLSRCNYLLAPKCGGTLISLLLNEGRCEDLYIFPDANNSKNY